MIKLCRRHALGGTTYLLPCCLEAGLLLQNSVILHRSCISRVSTDIFLLGNTKSSFQPRTPHFYTRARAPLVVLIAQLLAFFDEFSGRTAFLAIISLAGHFAMMIYNSLVHKKLQGGLYIRPDFFGNRTTPPEPNVYYAQQWETRNLVS